MFLDVTEKSFADSVIFARRIARPKPPMPRAPEQTAHCRAARTKHGRATTDTPPASRRSPDSTNQSAHETDTRDKNRAWPG